ncbi:MAG TPA: hypothetical protein VK806_04420 [Bacteroidia bacterium]|jgi:hypothetical protein|nr:hypothetical protein [Bacteroidia bacterium]
MKTNVVFIVTLLLSIYLLGQTQVSTFVIKPKPVDLNNKTFVIKLVQTKGAIGQRKWNWDKDEIVFKNNMLTSKLMNSREKFPAAAYTISIDSTTNENTIKFKMTSKNSYSFKATIELDGTITGNYIVGTAIWISRAGTYYYSFSGTLKQ